MDWINLLQGGLMITVASILIMYACNGLEQALDYLGRNMKAGAKGALLLAVASSLPEIMVAFAFLFSGKPELILAGVFVTAGSAIFNITIIPAVSILFAEDGNGNKVKSFELNRKSLTRDMFWLLSIEALFIYYLGLSTFTIAMAISLLVAYGLYVIHVIKDSNSSGEKASGFEFEELDHTETHGVISWIGKCLDFNRILFNNRELTAFSAIVVAILSCIVIGIACHYLAVSTETVSLSLGIPVLIGAAVFAAAATSLPDAILSVGAAKEGNGDDAVANAVGSNIFDTSFAIGLPLLIALTPLGTWLFGFDLSEGLPLAHGDAFQDTVRYFVIATSFLAASALWLNSKSITKTTAYLLLCMYASWVGYLVFMIV